MRLVSKERLGCHSDAWLRSRCRSGCAIVSGPNTRQVGKLLGARGSTSIWIDADEDKAMRRSVHAREGAAGSSTHVFASISASMSHRGSYEATAALNCLKRPCNRASGVQGKLKGWGSAHKHVGGAIGNQWRKPLNMRGVLKNPLHNRCQLEEKVICSCRHL